MKKIFAGLVAIVLLSGCESMYYDMVMDSRDQGKSGGKNSQDSMEQGTDSSHIGRYR